MCFVCLVGQLYKSVTLEIVFLIVYGIRHASIRICAEAGDGGGGRGRDGEGEEWRKPRTV